MRAKNIAGQAVVDPADGAGTVSFGSLRTPIARYIVFGADPNNPNHMIAADAENSQMKFSADGGTNWYPLPQLTQAVTGNGQYLFTVSELTLPSVIAWDPYDSCHILVGTIQNGIFRSTDSGNTWAQINGSKACTFVSSFYFPPSGQVWVSTNGRGLWTLNLNRQANPNTKCRFPDPRGRPQVEPPVAIDFATSSGQPFKGMDDPAVCPACSIIVVHNGWITDLQMTDDNVREVAISGGTIAQVDRSGREVPLAIPNVYQPGDGKLTARIKSRELEGSRRIRGLVLEGTRLRMVIASDTDLQFAPSRTPMVFVSGTKTAGMSSLEPGEPVRVIGTNFLPASGAGEPVRILFDGKVAAEKVPVRDDGSFSIDIPVTHLPGEMAVTAEQQDGRRLTRETATIDIVAQDRPE